MKPFNDAKMHARHAVRRSSPWIERLARVGIVARGLVYLVIGALAVQAAVGAGGTTTDTKGAMGAIHETAFGDVLLGIMAAGLFGFALWRFVQVVMNPEHERGAKGIMRRVGFAVSGLIHVGLGVTAIQLIEGTTGSGASGAPQHWTARALATPLGVWLVGLAGAIVIGFGVHQIYTAYKADFRKELELREMDARKRAWATRSGRVGLAARGVVFDIVGIFLVQAALRADPGQARGLDGALAALAARPFGSFLLGAVALGLVIFGLYCFVDARYRRIVAG